jgi:hypothetical protein
MAVALGPQEAERTWNFYRGSFFRPLHTFVVAAAFLGLCQKEWVVVPVLVTHMVGLLCCRNSSPTLCRRLAACASLATTAYGITVREGQGILRALP